MIGRFSKLGVYEELLQSRDFLKVGAGALLALVGFLVEQYAPDRIMVSRTLILASVAINGLPVIVGAVKGILEKRVNVDELLSLAIIASLLAGEFLTAAVVSSIMVLGALIEEATAESARKSIQTLIKVSPKKATILAGGEMKTVPVEEVRVGDILLVKPGEQVPVDGVVTEGSSSLDESAITGEAMPREKKAGDAVYAGTLNHNGLLRLRAERIGENTTLGQVIRLVSEAEAHKPKTIALIDRFAKYFTPLIMGCALVAWLITGDFSRAVAVLIVGCPCALILAVPTATVAAIGRAARAGVLVKGGQHIENVALADTIFFDKTGTLTEGNPRVDEIVPTEGIAGDELLRHAASVECNSTHPLARAVIQAAHYAKITINAARDLFTEIGLGVRGSVDGNLVEVGSVYLNGGLGGVPVALQARLQAIKEQGATPLMVYRDKQPIGFLSVSDRVRRGAGKTVAELQKLGLTEIGILSGDHEKSVDLVGRQVGISRLWSGLKPDDKLRVIREKQQGGAKIIYVGDGINDAPALAVADTGIAMGAKGTEVALETADIALMGDDIAKLPFLIALGRRMLFIIKLNIAFGLVFNLVSVLAGASGLITPIMGAVVHNVGSVLVVLSSASIGFFKDDSR
ncbi:MAG: copper-translocating P-type ATPase [Desulfobacterales bacterium GWB2_56_26]|nr:MAG: copper-translocating P-type ATPase [Desulfobacterales bacterium GWB2_56_26]